MSMLLQKGLGYTAGYTSIDYPVLNPDWVGSVSFYTTYPGVATFAKTMARVGNSMVLTLTIAEILNLIDGVYSVVSTMSSVVEGIEISSLEYATVSPVNISSATKCKIFGTIIKSDGTAAGSEGTALSNAANGTQLVTAWKGVDVKVSNTVVDVVTGQVVGVETISTKTNAAGYFEIYPLQGLVTTLTCPALGITIPINTTGLSEVNLFTLI